MHKKKAHHKEKMTEKEIKGVKKELKHHEKEDKKMHKKGCR
jgi:hypothetical protein